MRRHSIALATLLLAATVALPAAQAAQDPPATAPVPVEAQPPQQPEAPVSTDVVRRPATPDVSPVVQPPETPVIPDAFPFPEFPDDVGINGRRRTRGVVRVGQDFELSPGDFVQEAVVIFGDATIAGEVNRDLVVIFGTARLSSTAVINQGLVVVGGSAVAESGATVGRDLVIVGGTLDAPSTFIPGGEHVVIGSGMLGGWLEGVVPYVSRGLVWGRVIVPDLPWVWGVVAFFFLVYLVLNLIFDRQVRAGADTLSSRPLTAFGVGLLVLLLLGPVSLLLAISVAGLIVIPFLFCALLALGILGKIAVVRWIGLRIAGEESPDSRVQATRSLAIGSALIVLAYMVPVFGLVTWALVSVLGLGAASLAFVSAYRREHPRPPVQPRHVPPPPVPAGYPGSASAADGDVASAFVGASTEAVGDTQGDTVLPPPPGSFADMPRAWFRDRLAAFVLDVILVAIIASILDFEAGAVFLPLLLAYHIGFWTWKQTTVGGIICQLRLVRVDGTPLGFADALVRGLSSIFSIAVLFIGVLWILRDPDHQAWHDKIAGTFVVKVPRNWPL